MPESLKPPKGWRSTRGAGDSPVDVKVADPELAFDAVDVDGTARVDAAREGILGAVGDFQGLVQILGLEHGQDRAEDLLLGDPRTWRDIGHDEGADIGADVRQFADFRIEDDPPFLLREFRGIRGYACGPRRR